MLTFLFGRPGSGKTSYIIDQIRQSVAAGRKTYLLVPEQQVFISESMLADLPPSAALCFETVSFSRLAEIAFSHVGGLTYSRTSGGVRNLIMWQCMREMMPMLRQYKSIGSDRALSSMMLSVIDELRASSLTGTDCEELAKKLDEEGTNPSLSRKLYDIALIYATWESRLDGLLGEGALESENKLIRLKEALRHCKLFENCDFYIDSFTSFTGEEHAVLDEIVRTASNTCISFCCDGRGCTAPHLDSIRFTLQRFTRFARENSIQSRDVVLQVSQDSKTPELLMIEDKLWDFSARKDSLKKLTPDGSVIAVKCKNELDEARFAAMQILRAKNEGIKYSEMAVIMRDCESRKGIIDAVFGEMNLPYFYSQNTDLSSTPICRLLLSALRCLIYNFRTSDVLTLLKTGLCGIDHRDADLFEDYCYTWSITGNTFLADAWSMNPDGYTIQMSDRAKEILSAANRVRKALIEPLKTLRKKLAEADGDTTEGCRAIYGYLGEMKVSESLCNLAELELSQGNLKETGEMLRVYDYLVSVLTDVATVLRDVKTNADELCTAIEIMLSHTDIGSVPAVNDCVTVGSASTLRVENVKLTVVMGLCEGEFPQKYSDSGLLSESDKSIMASLGLALESREERIISDELFHVYRAMTKASSRLVLSTCSSTINGRAMEPSSAFNRVLFLLPELPVIELDMDKISALAEMLERNGDSQSDFGSGDPSSSEVTSPTTQKHGDLVEIDPLYVRMVFGDRLELTKSKIATFAQCPYRYWCEQVLKLREQKISEIGYADAGTIIHYVLEKFLSQVRQSDGSILRPSEEDTVRAVGDTIEEYVRGINCSVSPSLTYSFSRLRDLSLVMINSVLDEFDMSGFKIVAFEKQISEKKADALHPMLITVDESDSNSPTVSLGGTVDRIDMYDDGERKYLRIVDYKTGSHKYDVTKVSTGEDLQLPAYLFTAALKENHDFLSDDDKEIFPASALFLSADEDGGEISPVRSGFMLGEESFLRAANNELNRKMLAGILVKKNGEITGKAAVSEEEIRGIDETLRSSIKDTATCMYSGKAPRTPSKEACGFCSLRSSCPVASKDK